MLSSELNKLYSQLGKFFFFFGDRVCVIQAGLEFSVILLSAGLTGMRRTASTLVKSFTTCVAGLLYAISNDTVQENFLVVRSIVSNLIPSATFIPICHVV